MPNKNVTAAFITYCIALLIAWVIWGHTTDHIWSAWLFLVLLLVAIIVFILMIVTSLQSDTFDSSLFFPIGGIILFDLFLLTSVSNIGIFGLSIAAYIFGAFLLLLLIFTAVRFFIHQTS